MTKNNTKNGIASNGMKLNILKKITVCVYVGFLAISFLTPLNVSLAACNSTERLNSNGECVPNTSNYTLLAPLPKGDDTKLTDFNSGETSALGTYLNLVIKITIGSSAVLAMVMIVIGGIEYMTSELISSKEAGKERIRGALLGLILALGAYALLFTINPNLLNTDITINNTAIEVTIQNQNIDQPQTADADGNYTDPNTDNKYQKDAPWDNTVGSIGGVSTLPSGITTNHPGVDCAKVGDRNCTSIRGLDPTIVLATQTGCNCNFVINGGTEFWLHDVKTSKHGPGQQTVDISGNGNALLNKYITGKDTFPADNKHYKAQNGYCYVAESTHWHVSNNSCPGSVGPW